MFERYVQAQAKPAGQRAKLLLVLVSVGVHVALGVGLIAWSFVRTKVTAAPTTTVTFFSTTPSARPAPPPPPPLAGKKEGKSQPSRRPSTSPPRTQPQAPVDAPAPAPTRTASAPETAGEKTGDEPGPKNGLKDGSNEGAEGGQKDGLAGSTGAGTPTLAPPPRKPKNVAHEPSPDDYVSRPDPHLPDAVKAQRKGSGEAIFMAVLCVDTAGQVTSVRTLSGIPGADETIVAVLRRWQLKPQPIPICYPVRLIYTVD